MPTFFGPAGLLGKRRVPVLLQPSPTQCGPTCLRAIAAFHGRHLEPIHLYPGGQGPTRGTTLQHLLSLAQSIDLDCRALSVSAREMKRVTCPAIAHWKFDHFVVIERLRRKHVDIMDPATGRRRLSVDEFRRSFTGIAMEILPSRKFRREDRRHRLRLAELAGGLPNWRMSVAQLLTASLTAQALALTLPFFTQLVIDDVVASHDLQLLNILALSFLALGLIQAGMSMLRGWIALCFGARVRYLVSARVYGHLLRLPLNFFAHRHLGDLVSRFESLQAIQQLLTRTAPDAAMDLLMALLALALMFAYSPELSAVVLAAVGCHALLCGLLHPVLRDRTRTTLTFQARCQTGFLESLRCLPTVKVNALEHRIESDWLNRLANTINASLNLEAIGLWQQTGRQALAMTEKVAVAWLGARSVIAGNMTVGMLVAFLAYRQYLRDRAFALIAHAVEFGTSTVHRDRIADITTSAPETVPAPTDTGSGAEFLRFDASAIGFRYCADDPWLIRGVDVHLEPGRCVLICGPSGRGKSTLVRILLGILTPQHGHVRLDGHDLGKVGARFRSLTGAVMQDDALLDGTIAENISCLDPCPDRERMVRCAARACIHDTISALPLGYLSRVGDFGSTLSGGQRQRILLARALYRQPKILFLDEAFNQLDRATARACLRSIQDDGVALIAVSHRTEEFAHVDQVVRLGGT